MADYTGDFVFPSTGSTTTGTADPMADPTIAAGSTPSTTTSSTGDSSWLSGVNNFLSSPTGQLTAAAIPTGVALYGAGRASRQGQQLTNAITAAARPQLNLGTGTVNQLTGGPSVGGPMGNYIAGTTGNAATLTSAAAPYATGNLTPAQKLQVDAFLRQQNEMTGAAFAGTGGPGGTQGNQSSTGAIAQRTQNQNNAAMLTQELVNQNFQIAENAQASVGNTYTTLLQNSLAQSSLGAQATSDAVHQQLQNDQQVTQLVQQIMAGIAQQFTTAGGGQVAGQPSTPGGQLGGAVGNAIKQWGGGGGGVATPTTSAADPGIGGASSDLYGTTQADLGLSTDTGMAQLSGMSMPDFGFDSSSSDITVG